MRNRVILPVVVGTAALASAMPAHAATLVANWQMNETSGNTMIDSTGTSNGTLYNIAPNGSYYAFNGKNSVVRTTQKFTIGSSNLSFTARLRFGSIPSSSVGDYDIVRGAPTGKWKLEIVARNNRTVAQANCHFGGTRTRVSLAAGRSLADGAWHVVTCTKTATAVSLTVDGSTYTKSVSVGSIDTTGKEITLGAQDSGADEYKGDLDYVQVSVG